MKTGIITLVGNNYGNRLQNYAVQELLSEYGEVYTVKYEKKTSQSLRKSGFSRYNPIHIKEAVDSRLLNIYYLSNRKKNTVARLRYFLKNKDKIKKAITERNVAFQEFDNKYINYESELLHLTSDDNEPWVKSYDAWVCGSDQIWNPNYPTATRNAFLQFAPESRRIALSASIGISDVNTMLPEYSEWIGSIPYLSVREERAAEIITELTGKNAEVFLDPTMLISLEKWNQMADQAETKLPSKFAVGYFLGIREKKYDAYIQQEIKGLAYVDLLNGEATEYLKFGPDQVVDAIRKAEMVFVDSFHGAVFSILFHKQFVVFNRSEKGQTMNSRLETLLKRFGLKNRIFNDNNVEELRQPIDYQYIDQIIEKEKVRVHDFLDSAMKEISVLPKEIEREKKHIQISRSEKCSGCTACSQICPKKCITMQPDGEGFLYPVVDEERCIECGKCKAVCPVLYHDEGTIPQKVLAEKNRNEKIRSTSSSGGVFYELAKQFIQSGGEVYGCALDENMVARHICATSLDELDKLKSSKYVQSHMGNTMEEIKKKLLSGKKILFSGTPCQTAGLYNYLGKEYENLFAVDVLCHGVPSPQLFADYLEYLSKKQGGAKPISVNFRNKERGWKRLYMEVRFDNGKRHYIYSGYDRYEGRFLNNLSLRPSCYECKFTTTKRYGDITLGDFWGIGRKYPQWDDDKGISVVMLNTDKGMDVYNRIVDIFDSREETLETAKAGQRTLYAPTKKNPDRDAFYKLYAEKGCKEALERYTNVPSIFKRAYYRVMRWGVDILRKILRKGY